MSCAGTFYGLDKRSGQVRWSYDIRKDGDQTIFHGNPLVTEDLIIIGTDGQAIGHVYAFEKRIGRLAWKYPITHGLPERYGVPTDIVRSGSNVYAVAIGDELLCLDLKSGHLKWSLQKPYTKEQQGWNSTPSVAGGRVYLGALNGSTYALDAENGKVIWSRSLSRIQLWA